MENDPSVDECNANLALLTQAAVTEHALTPFQTMRKHWRAFLWCNFMCVGALSWGYNLQGGTKLLRIPLACGDSALTLGWNGAFSIVSAIGNMFGGLSVGWISDRIGRRGGIFVASVISIVGVLIQFVARTPDTLVIGFLINGFACGMFISCAIGYCAEVSPLALRGITTTAVSLWTVLGQFMFSKIPQGSISSEVVHPLQLALQWIFPLILLIGLPFAPESPWWLVRKGRYAAAERAIAHLGGPTVNVTFQRQKIQEMIELEDSYTATSSYIDCFRGENLKRTIVAMMVFVLQQGAGIGFVSWVSTYCFWTAGFVLGNPWRSPMGCTCPYAVATFTSTQVFGNLLTFWTVNRFGRRFLFKWGMVACASACLSIGIAYLTEPLTTNTNLWAVFSLTIIYQFVSQASIGPLGYVLSAEIPSAKLRFKTVGIGICANSLCVVLTNMAFSYMYPPNSNSSLLIFIWFMIFGVLGLTSSIWAHFFIPETKGRTVDQLDLLYARRVPAKNFASYQLQGDGDEGECISGGAGAGVEDL